MWPALSLSVVALPIRWLNRWISVATALASSNGTGGSLANIAAASFTFSAM